jgi:hypothetical protein
MKTLHGLDIERAIALREFLLLSISDPLCKLLNQLKNSRIGQLGAFMTGNQ